MKKTTLRTITFLTLALAALALAGSSLANGGDDGHGKKSEHQGAKDDHGDRVKHKGKRADHGRFAVRSFTFVTTDGGSCGNEWANDVSHRTYVVKDNGDGTFRLTRFDHGDFTTIAGASPGKCDTTGKHGTAIRAGVTGKLKGYITGTVTGGRFNSTVSCTAADCGARDVFLKTFFGPSAVWSCDVNSADCRFDFHYRAKKNQTLLFRHWQGTGTGAGTFLKEEFHGDIADA